MPPGDVPLPDSLVPGNGAVRPTLNTGGYGGSYQSQTPTSPADTSVPFDSPRRQAGRNGSVASGHDSQNPDGRMGRRLDTNLSPIARDPSTPRDSPTAYWDRPTPRDRSRPGPRSHTKSPGSTPRVCKKCGEPLVGQFVRALGATFHLECFRCEVSGIGLEKKDVIRSDADLVVVVGLRPDCRVQVFPCRRGRWQWTISPLRDRLFSTFESALSRVWWCSARLVYHGPGA